MCRVYKQHVTIAVNVWNVFGRGSQLRTPAVAFFPSICKYGFRSYGSSQRITEPLLDCNVERVARPRELLETRRKHPSGGQSQTSEGISEACWCGGEVPWGPRALGRWSELHLAHARALCSQGMAAPRSVPAAAPVEGGVS